VINLISLIPLTLVIRHLFRFNVY